MKKYGNQEKNTCVCARSNGNHVIPMGGACMLSQRFSSLFGYLSSVMFGRKDKKGGERKRRSGDRGGGGGGGGSDKNQLAAMFGLAMPTG